MGQHTPEPINIIFDGGLGGTAKSILMSTDASSGPFLVRKSDLVVLAEAIGDLGDDLDGINPEAIPALRAALEEIEAVDAPTFAECFGRCVDIARRVLGEKGEGG